MRSNDVEGSFYCHSQSVNNEEQRQLTASIEHPPTITPTLLMRTEPMNSTTIRIRIQPNGYIGISQISCYWNNSFANRQIADLIIGGMIRDEIY